VTGYYFETGVVLKTKKKAGLRSQPAPEDQALVSLEAKKDYSTIMYSDECDETSRTVCI
jgi:hypothetical protein